MVPAKVAPIEKPLRAFYERTEGIAYKKQALAISSLVQAASSTGLQFAGFVQADGKPSIANPGLKQSDLWGLTTKLKPERIYQSKKDGPGYEPVMEPSPLSPLFTLKGHLADLSKEGLSPHKLAIDDPSIGPFLPPLFKPLFKQGEIPSKQP
jgi:hypothetical protein